MKVRIKVTPREREIDGVSLEGFDVGTVREVSPLVGAWLVAEEYAEPEMRRTPSSDEEFSSPFKSLDFRQSATDRRRKG